MAARPAMKNSESEKELNKAEAQFEAFEQSVKDLTQDRMNLAPKQETEPQTKLAQKDIEKSKEIYLKPERSIGAGPKEVLPDYLKKEMEFDKEYVHFIAEHKEIIGDNIEIWTKKYPTMPCEYWVVPTGKPVWGPRYLAEQIKTKCYHRLRTEDRITSSNGSTSFYGTMVVDTTIQRLDAIPVSPRKSIFMGAAA